MFGHQRLINYVKENVQTALIYTQRFGDKVHMLQKCFETAKHVLISSFNLLSETLPFYTDNKSKNSVPTIFF